ncbi:MAG: hypothetical protein R3C30_05370 [Hyphomonadaceae bacterium]
MKLAPPSLITQHRLKRLAAWAMLMLVWMAQAFFSDAAPPAKRRYLRQRYRLSLDEMARRIYAMIIVRAGQLLKRRSQAGRLRHFSAPSGFAYRRAGRQWLRTLIGSTLRKRLYARNPLLRIARLLAAVRDLDAFAAYIAKRLRRGLGRAAPIVATRPPHDAVSIPRTVEPRVCNSS